MAKRVVKLPSVEELNGELTKRSPKAGLFRGAIDLINENLEGGVNLDGGVRDANAPEDRYQVDPDPTANTSLQLQATSTTNPSRPRTLSAGYDSKKQTLTVVFRDGTYWNYYDVPVNIWEGFRQAESKGKYLASSGLNTWDSMGPADLSGMTDSARVRLAASINMASQMQKSSGGRQQSKQGPQFQ